MPGRLLLLIALLVVALYTNAQVYKWTDENGVVHYGDERPDQAHRPFHFRGYSEIQMKDNVRASQAVSVERRALEKPRSGRNHEAKEQSEQRKAEKKAAECQSYVDRIGWIDSRLRAGGYSVGQGNRLRAERRKLSGKRAWECLRN